MTPSLTATAVDCRGQHCPAPILATAKAARTLGSAGGGTLEVSADDAAFPLDIRSWCRSSGSQLLGLVTVDGVHTALVRVGSHQAETAAGCPAPGEAKVFRPPPLPPANTPTPSAKVVELPAVLDFRGQSCPDPILGLARRARVLGPGAHLEVIADDPAFRLDLESWCRSSGARLLSMEPQGSALRARLVLGGRPEGSTTVEVTPFPSPNPVRSTPMVDVISLHGIPASGRLAYLERRVGKRAGGSIVRVIADDTSLSAELVQWAAAAGHHLLSLDARGPLEAELELARVKLTGRALTPEPSASTGLVPRDEAWPVPTHAEDLCTLLVLHNDREALLAALLVGVGAAAQGMKVMMFFTFWGLNLLRGDGPDPAMPKQKVSWTQRLLKWMMPRGPRQQKLGKLDMGGLGRTMLGSIMKRYALMDIPDLMTAAEEQGVRFVACTMSMQVMGITKRDLAPRPNLRYGGVAAFVESAGRSRMSLTF